RIERDDEIAAGFPNRCHVGIVGVERGAPIVIVVLVKDRPRYLANAPAVSRFHIIDGIIAADNSLFALTDPRRLVADPTPPRADLQHWGRYGSSHRAFHVAND